MIIEGLSKIITSISFLNTEFAIFIAIFLIGLSIVLSSKSELGLLLNTTICWIFALVLQESLFSITLLISGIFTLIISFLKYYHKIQKSIYTMAVLSLIINLNILIITNSISFVNNNDNISESNILPIINKNSNLETPDTEIDVEKNQAGFIEQNPKINIFDLLQGMLNIFKYIGKLGELAIKIQFTGFYLGKYIMESPYIKNKFAGFVIGLILQLWNLMLLKRIFDLVFNKRGEK